MLKLVVEVDADKANAWRVGCRASGFGGERLRMIADRTMSGALPYSKVHAQTTELIRNFRRRSGAGEGVLRISSRHRTPGGNYRSKLAGDIPLRPRSNAGESLDSVLNRVAAAGGEIATPKTALLPGMGAFAHIIDTEGNRVGLHAAG